MKNYSLLFLLLIGHAVYAQVQIDRSVIGSAGKDVQTPNIQISYNIGEVAVKTVKTGSIILTQGFEQNDVNSVGISPLQEDLNITAYPNPSSGAVILELENARPETVDIEVYDLNGRNLMRKRVIEKTKSVKELLNFSGYAAGQYLITVKIEGKEVQKTMKVEIIK